MSDHDVPMLTLHTPLRDPCKPRLVKISRKCDDSSIRDFTSNLSYENWEDVFNTTSKIDINVMFNNFLNTYLRIFYGSFPQFKSTARDKCKGWLTKGILTSCKNKKDLYLLCRISNNSSLKNFYKKILLYLNQYHPIS